MNHPSHASEIGETDPRRTDVRLRTLKATLRDVRRYGVGYLTAEDRTIDGRFVTLDGRRLVNFGSCSYLGLETDARLKEGACDAVTRFGVQFASSRAYVSCPPYAELESLLGAMFGGPLVVAQTTTLAHFAALPLLVSSRDAVVCDQMVHNSVQAVLPTLAQAGTFCRIVRHGRVDRIEALVCELAKRYRRVWYLADGVYSMHGDLAPLAELRELLARHEALCLYIDDAHGVSWSGKHGRGTVLGEGPPSDRLVVAASLAKGFSAGGAVLVFPDAEVAELVRAMGSTMMFSGPLQPALLGAGIASARIHLSGELEGRQAHLVERIRLFNTLAEEHGLLLGSTAATPIRFVKVGDNEKTYRAASALMRDGFYTNLAVFPAVSEGHGGLRIALTLHQTSDDIRALVTAISNRVRAPS